MGLGRETEVEHMDKQETVGGNYCFIITLQRGGGEGKRNIMKSWYGGCRLKKTTMTTIRIAVMMVVTRIISEGNHTLLPSGTANKSKWHICVNRYVTSLSLIR